MKHVLLWVILACVAAWFIAAHRGSTQERPSSFRTVDSSRRSLDQAHRDALRAAAEARHQVKQAMAQVRIEVHQAAQQARQEVHAALHDAHQQLREARLELHDAHEEVQEALAETVEQPFAEAPLETPALPSPPDSNGPPGFPGLVPHPPSSHSSSPPVTAVLAPPGRTRSSPDRPEDGRTRTVVGLVGDTEDNARAEARKKLDEEVAHWLEMEGLPRSWKPSSRLIDEMILECRVRPISTDYGASYKVYEAQLKVDVSPERRAIFHQSYQRQLVHGRLILMGGALAFILACLGAVSGYIRADEATKGYYTKRLRLLAAAGVGAAGMAIYHALA